MLWSFEGVSLLAIIKGSPFGHPSSQGPTEGCDEGSTEGSVQLLLTPTQEKLLTPHKRLD